MVSREQLHSSLLSASTSQPPTSIHLASILVAVISYSQPTDAAAHASSPSLTATTLKVDSRLRRKESVLNSTVSILTSFYPNHLHRGRGEKGRQRQEKTEGRKSQRNPSIQGKPINCFRCLQEKLEGKNYFHRKAWMYAQ